MICWTCPADVATRPAGFVSGSRAFWSSVPSSSYATTASISASNDNELPAPSRPGHPHSCLNRTKQFSTHLEFLLVNCVGHARITSDFQVRAHSFEHPLCFL